MGYLFLFLALFAGATKGFCGKKTSGLVEKNADAMLFNIVRMLMCIVIGLVIVCANGQLALLRIEPKILVISILSGVFTSSFVVFWLLSVRKSAYMMLDIFLMLGTIIPTALSTVLFDEKISATQVIGLVILLISVCIMCSYNNSIKEKLSIASVVILIVCGASNGLTDFMQKLFVKTQSSATIEVFNLYTYVFSALSLAVVYSVFEKKFDREFMAGTAKKLGGAAFYIIIMSVCLFLNSYFKLIAARYLSAAELYPMSQGLGMIIATIMSSVFFKERITPKCVLGIILAFVALIFINVL